MLCNAAAFCEWIAGCRNELWAACSRRLLVQACRLSKGSRLNLLARRRLSLIGFASGSAIKVRNFKPSQLIREGLHTNCDNLSSIASDVARSFIIALYCNVSAIFSRHANKKFSRGSRLVLKTRVALYWQPMTTDGIKLSRLIARQDRGGLPNGSGLVILGLG